MNICHYSYLDFLSIMEDIPKGCWSWEENKLFELALAVVDEQHPRRWELVAAMIGGQKSAQEVLNHYVILLEDVQVIDSGKLDHKLNTHCPPLCWTDQNNKILLHLNWNNLLYRSSISREEAYIDDSQPK
ncbi:hypothetical protein F8388_007382 [Cannabis sativa]|uniref:Myb-like domain-containing protein n=1 Tax=Cannabis sativa TaxID=3483 RepID=A0A7J6FHQ8_CANSA|nr:hypothetical protein F8388_007382 [Cannabis sativa]